MERKGFLGGSDISAVMGVSRWKTPLQLWAEKTGEVEPADLSENQAVQLGIELEEFCAKKFEKETGMKVRRAPQVYTSKENPFMSCQVDRLITGTDELLEIKTCSAWKEKEWEGEEIPQEYILQISWQLMITGRRIGHVCVLIGGQKFVYKKIEADPELFRKMTDAAITFWSMVQTKTPPVTEAADNKFMVELYPSAGELIKAAAQDVTDAVAMLQQTKAQIIALEETKDEIEAKLKAVIGDAQGVKTEEYLVKWINIKGSTFTVCKKDGRMLRITKNKEK
jgi:putative phage-type endonuclease